MAQSPPERLRGLNFKCLDYVNTLGLMRLRYNITRKDVIGAGFRTTLANKVVIGILLVVIVTSWWSIFTGEKFVNLPLYGRLLLATVVAAFTTSGGILAAFLISVLQAAMLKNGQGTLGIHTLEITDEGLVEQTDVNRTVSNWRSPFKVKESKHYGYIFVSPAQVHLIPLSRPALEGSPREFLSEFRHQANLQQGTS